MVRWFLFAIISAASLIASVTMGYGGASTIQAIRDAVVAKCSFLPTVSTISAILAINDPTLQTASQVSSAVCAAITASKNKRGPPNVSGVVIRGCPVMR